MKENSSYLGRRDYFSKIRLFPRKIRDDDACISIDPFLSTSFETSKYFLEKKIRYARKQSSVLSSKFVYVRDIGNIYS